MGRVAPRPVGLKPKKPLYFNIDPTGTGAFGSANQFRGSFVTIDRPVLVDRARIRVNAGGGANNISVAIYNRQGTTRLTASGAIATPANGNADVVLPEVFLAPGVYFVGMSCDSITPTFVTNASAHVKGAALTAGAHPAPATVVVDDGSVGSLPVIGLFHS